jgi:hypothetical protein
LGSGEENRALRADKGFEALSNYRYRYLDNDDVYHHEPHHDWASNGGDAHVQSESYFDANVRRQTERNIAHFSNRHAPGSKYYSPQYKHRNKGFRPKTRSMVRKNESALAKALFSTTDVVHISAERDWDPQQKASASVIKDLMQYRLEETMPWFMTVQGAYQDALVQGVVISYQSWEYDEIIDELVVIDEAGSEIFDEYGDPAFDEDVTVVKDTPAIDLRPIENIRFASGADWRDPIGTSPFLIDEIPMTIGEVKLMATSDNKTKIPWFPLTDSQLLAGRTTDYNSVRNAREGNREDSKDQTYLCTVTLTW